jgi:hypothetical protein
MTMHYFIMYFDATDAALNRVGPFTDFDTAIDAACQLHGMPKGASLPSEVRPAYQVPDYLPLVTIQ